MIKRRLLILAEHLERIAKRKPKSRSFNLDKWFEKTPCGTAACAVGSACFIPEFKRLGLRLRQVGSAWYPVFKGDAGYTAAARFFGISWGAAETFFCPDSYKPDEQGNPLAVATRIREFVAAKGGAL